MEQEQRQTEPQHFIKGEPLYTIFQNAAEKFSIVKIKIIETNTDYKEKEIVVKGYFSNLQPGTVYNFFGNFEDHAKFGRQYAVTAYRTELPDTRDGLAAYLSSDMFPGIGRKTAMNIIDTLGEGCIAKILDDATVLSKVPGLKKEKAKKLAEVLQANQGFEHVVVYLSKYRIGLKMAQKIYQEYKEEAIEILEKDPYQFVFDIDGFGFVSADAIAAKNGLSMTHPNRIGAGCIYVLQNSVQEGHVFLPMKDCIQAVRRLLVNPKQQISEALVAERLQDLNTTKKLIIYQGNVYLPSLYYAEDGVASNLKRILDKPIEHETTMAEMMKITGEIEEEETLSYGKEQFDAISQALHSKVMILTGGPGTGKTTVIKGILKAYSRIHGLSLSPGDYDKKSDFPFVLAAPTGRAAKRMTESTSLPAKTIHRLLGWNGSKTFEKDEHEQLDGKFLIVDEFSMVDIWLANQLFKAIPDDMQVLLVGDEDQLPSVGPGQVLTDLLGSEVIPFVTLHEVYRQKEGSHIIQLAHQIKNNACNNTSFQNDNEFSFIACNELQVVDVILQIFQKAEQKGLDPGDIQVLAPMYRSAAGINAINKALQQQINPKSRQKREVVFNEQVFRVGDRVIQLVNQPEDGVFNGDIGRVAAIFREEENVDNVEQLVVEFDEKEVVYERKNYDNIMHAYCISIHKSQGSEFPIVILPVVKGYRRMLRKNLLYTAITRAKQSLIICGQQQSFLLGVETLDTNRRFTSLRQLIGERFTESEISTGKGEEELSPYDFM
ncbi:ATP-dependent RecD-like DNA helicase [Virgibacillus sp. 179-BFC.A HS]|uniref:ATP-dependent RecD2 DNA helicase n=1 Tax=Tigheibacillus jepli TaxID=3035914 RepID=A0ABU5CHQ5_9BACI|nr:ATP-dependent RecD-like DNA helicase [Virgibacillus sp. 179-BFC.A HS]MDY0405491.1 ATP-dependent RecD-like DNA helicase [Virgibacillus sp. 179-BFC.A HS]